MIESVKTCRISCDVKCSPYCHGHIGFGFENTTVNGGTVILARERNWIISVDVPNTCPACSLYIVRAEIERQKGGRK